MTAIDLINLREAIEALIDVEEWDDLEPLLCDIDILELKAESGMVFELAANFLEVEARMPSSRALRGAFALFGQGISHHIQFLAAHPRALFQCLWNSCWWHNNPKASKYFEQSVPACVGQDKIADSLERCRVSTLLEGWRHQKDSCYVARPWVRSLRPPHTEFTSGRVYPVDGVVYSVGITDDGGSVFASHETGSISTWHCGTGEASRRLHDQVIPEITPRREFLYSFGWPELEALSWWRDYTPHVNQTVRAWVSPSGRRILLTRNVLRNPSHAHTGGYRGMGAHLTGKPEIVVTFWETKERTEEVSMQCDTPDEVAFSPDESFCALRTDHETLVILNWSKRCEVESGRFFTVCEGRWIRDVMCGDSDGSGAKCGRISAFCFRQADDKSIELYVVIEHQVVVLWTVTHNRLATIVAHIEDGDIECVAYSSRQGTLAIGRKSTSVDVESLKVMGDSTATKIVAVATRDMSVCVFSSDGSQLATGGSGRVVVWNVTRNRVVASYVGHSRTVDRLAFSYDNCRVVSAEDGAIHLWSIGGDVIPRVFRYCDENVDELTYSPTGTFVVSRSGNKTHHWWSLTGSATGYETRPTCGGLCTFGNDDMFAILDSLSCMIALMLPTSGLLQVRDYQSHHRGGAKHIVASSATPTRIAMCDTQTVSVWSIEGREEPEYVLNHEGELWEITKLAIDAEGRMLASGGSDGSVRIWDLASGRVCVCRSTSEGCITCMEFSRDGRYLATGSSYGFARAAGVDVWDTQDGRGRFYFHGEDVSDVAFSDDGHKLSSSTTDGYMYVWRLVNPSQIRIGYMSDEIRVHFVDVRKRRGSSGSTVNNDHTSQCCQVIAGKGDIRALIKGYHECPWMMVSRGSESIVFSQETGEEVAAYPLAFDLIVTHASGDKWAASAGKHLYFLNLEPAKQKTTSVKDLSLGDEIVDILTELSRSLQERNQRATCEGVVNEYDLLEFICEPFREVLVNAERKGLDRNSGESRCRVSRPDKLNENTPWLPVTDEVKQAIERAQGEALQRGDAEPGKWHLLLGLLHGKNILSGLQRGGVADVDDTIAAIDYLLRVRSLKRGRRLCGEE